MIPSNFIVINNLICLVFVIIIIDKQKEYTDSGLCIKAHYPVCFVFTYV